LHKRSNWLCGKNEWEDLVSTEFKDDTQQNKVIPSNIKNEGNKQQKQNFN